MLTAESSLLEDGRHTTARKNRTTMCSQCRHDKQKCNPVNRDWNRLQQKCERCLKLGYACGPSERAPRKSRKASSDTNTADLHQEGEHLTSSTYMSQDSLWSSLPWGDPASHFPHYSPPQTNGPTPPAPASTCMSLDFAIHASHDIPQRSAESCTTELLTQLGDLYATRQLLRRELIICDQVERWTGLTENTAQVQATTEDFICKIKEDFEHCVKRARYIVTTSMTSISEKTMLELYLIAYKFAHPPPPATIDQDLDEYGIGAPDRSSTQWLLHTLHETSSRHSTADFVCRSISSPAPTFAPVNTMEIYQSASTAVSRILSEISLRSFEHKKLFSRPPACVHLDFDADAAFGYPACHLAAMHGHQLVAFELWRSSTHRKWELDWFKRTPVHTAAYAGKTYGLQYIFENYAAAATDVSKDIFGLTPLMIAACKDDVKTFNLLRRHGADLTVKDLRGRNILALAARNGSQSIVKLLLCQDSIPPSLRPESSELYEAITHERSAITDLLISHHSQHKHLHQHDLQQIQASITLAEQKGLNDIVGQLQKLCATHSYDDIDSFSVEASYIYPYDLEQNSIESLTDDMTSSPYSAEIANLMDWTDLGTREMTAVTLSGTLPWT